MNIIGILQEMPVDTTIVVIGEVSIVTICVTTFIASVTFLFGWVLGRCWRDHAKEK